MLTVHPAEIPVFARLPFRPVRGEGCWLVDRGGRRCLDLYGGHAVSLSGHGHPRVVEAIRRQSEALLFCSNALPLDARDALFALLAELAPSGLERAFLVNSGAEANDLALAIARRVTGRSAVVSLEGGFHGRSLATLAVSGIDKYRAHVEYSAIGRELAAETRVCPFDDVDALENVVDPSVAAVIVEPVQGLGGARNVSPHFLRRARELCNSHGALLIFDEVQCGCGRVGAFTAAAAYGVNPDLLTLAKGIAAGLPLGALLARQSVVAGFGTGDLGSTFGGGPVPCAAAVANLSLLADERLAENALERERQVRDAAASLPPVQRVQGCGLLLGLVLDRPAAAVQRALLERDILVGSSADPHVLRLLPPLVVTAEQISMFIEAFAEILRERPAKEGRP
jgi:acetylornithine/succinyldiaminopimelate/putrescine aminotransferase